MAPQITKETGRRLITSLIDEIARDYPSRIWASIPKDNSNLSKGFRDITFKEFANAINHAAHWLKESLKGERISYETLAYGGPKDLRHPIIAVAASKCEKKVSRERSSTEVKQLTGKCHS